MPFWHPKGTVVWNALEELRRRENEKRGYVEVRTPLLYDVDTWVTSGHWEKFEGPHVPRSRTARTGRWHEADELPRPHAPLRKRPPQLPRASSSLRGGLGAPPQRAAPGTLHGLLRVQHVTQDDAHIFVTHDQIQDEIFGALDFAAYLYELFGMEARRRALDAAREQARHGRGVGLHGERAPGGARQPNEIQYTITEGDGAFYGPKIDLHMDGRAGPLVADGDDPARLADAVAVRAQVRRRGQRRARRRTSSIARSTDRSSASSAS